MKAFFTLEQARTYLFSQKTEQAIYRKGDEFIVTESESDLFEMEQERNSFEGDNTSKTCWDGIVPQAIGNALEHKFFADVDFVICEFDGEYFNLIYSGSDIWSVRRFEHYSDAKQAIEDSYSEVSTCDEKFSAIEITENESEMQSIFEQDGEMFICYIANTKDWNNLDCIEFGMAKYDKRSKKPVGDWFNTYLCEYSNEFVEALKKIYFKK